MFSCMNYNMQSTLADPFCKDTIVYPDQIFSSAVADQYCDDHWQNVHQNEFNGFPIFPFHAFVY